MGVPGGCAGDDGVGRPLAPWCGSGVPTSGLFGVVACLAEALAVLGGRLAAVRDGDRVVDEGFTTAKECCTLSPYSFEVDAPAGDYVLRVYDADMSGGEGNGEAEDTKRITIR